MTGVRRAAAGLAADRRMTYLPDMQHEDGDGL